MMILPYAIKIVWQSCSIDMRGAEIKTVRPVIFRLSSDPSFPSHCLPSPGFPSSFNLVFSDN